MSANGIKGSFDGSRGTIGRMCETDCQSGRLDVMRGRPDADRSARLLISRKRFVRCSIVETLTSIIGNLLQLIFISSMGVPTNEIE